MARALEIAQLGASVIRERAAEVIDIHDPQLQAFIDDLFATVADANGMGIAAPQVSVAKRIIILSPKPNNRYPYAPTMKPTAMINPEMTWASSDREKDWEGCLTVPGIRGLVPRHRARADLQLHGRDLDRVAVTPAEGASEARPRPHSR